MTLNKTGESEDATRPHSGSDTMRRRHRRRRRRGRKRENQPGNPKIVLVGNPNVGKSVIFGALTGKYVDVSNYPGTSVEITRGMVEVEGRPVELIDSPGINGLVPRSEDEQVALNILLNDEVIGVIQVIDAKNLKRGLLITHQLIELGLPLVVCLNMFDESSQRGIKIEVKDLSSRLGIKVIPTVAISGRGMGELKRSLNNTTSSSFRIPLPAKIEQTVERISARIPDNTLEKRGLAEIMVSGEGNVPYIVDKNGEEFKNFVNEEIASLTGTLLQPPGFTLQTHFNNYIESYIKEIFKADKVAREGFKEKLGFVTMHPVYGIPFILLVLFILYELVGVFGAGTAVDFIETDIFGGYDSEEGFFGIINPLFIRIFAPLGNSGVGGFINEMFVGEYGAITVGLTYSIAIVFPIVTLFFIFFGLLEDSGYLPRLTVLSNNLFRRIGLNGRAILPIVLGLGCDTMATFTARILETKKERTIITLLLALGVPCSAQLGVVLGMMGALSPIMLMVVIITVVSQLAIVGYGASKVLKGKSASLIAEIPPFRVPRLKNILIKTYFRVRLFMREAVPLFILGTFILFMLDKFNLLVLLEKAASPVITGILQLPAEATKAFIVGFLRRDYGAAGLFHLVDSGMLDLVQITVGVTVMVLFVPCLANFFVIIKERGLKTAMIMNLFIIVYAVIVGGILNQILRIFI